MRKMWTDMKKANPDLGGPKFLKYNVGSNMDKMDVLFKKCLKAESDQQERFRKLRELNEAIEATMKEYLVVMIPANLRSAKHNDVAFMIKTFTAVSDDIAESRKSIVLAYNLRAKYWKDTAPMRS